MILKTRFSFANFLNRLQEHVTVLDDIGSFLANLKSLGEKKICVSSAKVLLQVFFDVGLNFNFWYIIGQQKVNRAYFMIHRRILVTKTLLREIRKNVGSVLYSPVFLKSSNDCDVSNNDLLF